MSIVAQRTVAYPVHVPHIECRDNRARRTSLGGDQERARLAHGSPSTPALASQQQEYPNSAEINAPSGAKPRAHKSKLPIDHPMRATKPVKTQAFSPALPFSVIFDVLNNESSPHKLFAAISLGERGHKDAVPVLKRLLDDEDGGVRSEASLAIWKITGDSADALTVGRSLLDDPDWLVRHIGVEHFEELGVGL